MRTLILAAIFASSAALADDSPSPKAGRKSPVMIKADDLKFVESPKAAGVQIATLWGDMSKGNYGAIAKFPPGQRHPLHTHTADLKTVVVSGTWVTGADDASAKEYGPGSYLFIPGGWKHVSGCKEGAECMLFQQSPGKFDLMPADSHKVAGAK
jgi:oxalate decarboxylase/phosphoglucose isomerase-like protein (cupin superfamily)